MMKFNSLRYALLGLLALPTLAQAQLTLEVTKGVKGAIPIGTTTFAWQGASANAPVDVSKIVAADLQNSGSFRLFSGQNKPLPNGQPDLTYWKQQKVNAVLTGTVQNQGNDQYQVSYTLTNVFKNPSNPDMSNNAVFGVDSGAALAQQQFLVSKKDLRNTAHQIANQIYQKLTGKPGVFLTRLAYVLVTKNNEGQILYQLMTADYDGHNPKLILSSREPILTPAWSPDGKQLAYVAYENKQAGVYISDLASGTRRMIVDYPGVDSAPSFSADGKSLAVVLSKDNGDNIYQVNLSSGELTPLTKGLTINTSPKFSSDGRYLYFTSTQGGSPQIYRMDLKSNIQTRMSFAGQANMSPTVANQKLAYVQQQGDQFQVVTTQDGQVVPISAKGLVSSPSFAPDASMIVYSMYYNNQQRLVLETLALGQQLLLPAQTGAMRYPAWSPLMK